MEVCLICDCCGNSMELKTIETNVIDSKGNVYDLEFFVCPNCGSECLWKYHLLGCQKSFWDNVNKQFFKVFYTYDYFHKKEVLGNEY